MARKRVTINSGDQHGQYSHTLTEKERKAIEKDRENARKAQEKRQKEINIQSQIDLVDAKNKSLQRQITALESILATALTSSSYIDLNSLKFSANFVAGDLAKETPKPRLPETPKPNLLQSFLPPLRKKLELETQEAEKQYKLQLMLYKKREQERQEILMKRKNEHAAKVNANHRQIDSLKENFANNVPKAVSHYFSLVLEASIYPAGFPKLIKSAYVPESKQLVIEYDLPKLDDCIPETKEFRYVKSKDEITSTSLPATQRKQLYASVIAQTALRTLFEVFQSDRTEKIDTVVFNGYVETIDPATGQQIRPCLVTIRTTRDVFAKLHLHQVDPIACLKGLNASVSPKPEELAPVRPVLEFSMVDPRFVEEADVLSTLDQRQNLMDLSPFEFENLITNLFQKMGLETRQTQSSRDGGVDCVAYDPRPIFGGKVVIQAKRYKNTVGVSAVRDLYGTLQNEGASKGILVTTSGYGKAAFEFAEGKPIELLDGSNLLYLLAEHANLEAKIEVPDSWQDPKVN